MKKEKRRLRSGRQVKKKERRYRRQVKKEEERRLNMPHKRVVGWGASDAVSLGYRIVP